MPLFSFLIPELHDSDGNARTNYQQGETFTYDAQFQVLLEGSQPSDRVICADISVINWSDNSIMHLQGSAPIPLTDKLTITAGVSLDTSQMNRGLYKLQTVLFECGESDLLMDRSDEIFIVVV